jgi:hypothetical protein
MTLKERRFETAVFLVRRFETAAACSHGKSEIRPSNFETTPTKVASSPA